MGEKEFLKLYMKDMIGEEGLEALSGYRVFTETLFPKLALDFKLKEGWDYKDMYLGLLEDLAKRLKVKRFRIYTVEALLFEIRKKIHSLGEGASF